MRDWRAVQARLKELGFNPGPVDGIRGRKTEGALIEFALSKLDLKEPSGDQPEWLRRAYGYLGQKEIKGWRHNPNVLRWWQDLDLHFRDDETPWCAGFANGMLAECGLPLSPKYRAAALGWRWTGYGTRLDGPALGAFMTMTRPGRRGSGHKTIVAGRDRLGRIMGLGGNQSNKVGINPYHPTNRDAQYHWPEGVALPTETGMHTLPIIDATGGVLSNEA